MRRAGYPVAVDGQWGAVSQRYWGQYKKQGRFEEKPRSPQRAVAAAALERAKATAETLKPGLRGAGAIEPRRLRAARQVRDPGARLQRFGDLERAGYRIDDVEVSRTRVAAAKAEVAKRRDAAGRQAYGLGQVVGAGAVGQLSLRELGVLLLDEEFGGLDSGNPFHAQLVQRWLRAHGHAVAETGRFDTPTIRALEAAQRREQGRERQRQTEALVQRYYKTGVLRTGATPVGFPLGRVPTPRELLATVQAGGFTAAMTIRWLEAAYRRAGGMTGDPEYRLWRAELLQRARRQEFGPFGVPKFGGKVWIGSRDLGEVYAARNWEDLQRRLTALERREEQRRLESERKSWVRAGLSDALHGVGEALDFVARGDQILEGLSVAKEVLFNPQVVAQPDGSYAIDVRTTVERAEVAGPAALQAWRDRHPWLYLGLELAVDPINYTPGWLLKAPFAGVRLAALGAENAGLRLAATGMAGGQVAFGLRAPALLGRYIAEERATAIVALHKRAAIARSTDPLDRSLRQKALVKTTGMAKRAAQLRDATEAVVQIRLRELARLNFEKVKVAATRAGATSLADPWKEMGKTLTGVTRAELDQTIDALAGRLHEVAPDLYASLVNARASIYAGHSTGEYSAVGWQLWARLQEAASERARVNIARAEAVDVAAKQAERAAEGLGEEAARAAYGRVYAKVYAQVYERTLGKLGTHFAGSADPKYAGLVAKETRELRDWVDRVYLPALQRRLVQTYEREGFRLWDEAGLWAGRQGENQLALRLAAKEAVLNPAAKGWRPNPIFGEVLSRAERDALVADEVERRLGSYYGWVAVRRAAGDEISEDVVQARVGELVGEVERNWIRVKGGFTDKRKEIEVPEIYSRDAIEGSLDAAKVAERFIREAVAAGVDPRTPGGLLAFSMPTAAVKGGGFGVPDARAVDGDVRRVLGWLSFAQVDSVGEGAKAELVAFSQAARARFEAVERATKEVTAEAYRHEGAWLEALRHAQLAPYRAIWYGAVGATSLWKFSVLALRPAWTVRNIFDNTVKTLLEASLDPRVLLAGGQGAIGKEVRSVLQIHLTVLRDAAAFLDRIAGTNAAVHLQRAIDGLWDIEAPVLRRVFVGHGVDVPEALIERARFVANEGRLSRWKEGIWHLMGTRPEDFFRRGLYRFQVEKGIARGLSEEDAHLAAWASVERTLFDYSKVSNFEENFKVFWPFIQFWRKNAGFWARTAVTKPWFVMTVAHWDQQRREIHPEWPGWMRRYVHVDDVTDGLAQVPGVGDWLAKHVSGLGDVMSDPMNYLSFAPLYRTFKQENPYLPPDRQGWAFLSTFVDLVSEWGLGWNPMLRKPLEMAGVLNYRAWQHVFPQTDVVAAFTRKFWFDRFGKAGLDLEALLMDPIFEAIGQETSAELIAQRFDEFVQTEMAGQQLRGEPVDRAKAEEKIRDYLLIQALLGFTMGAYARRATPEDIHLFKLAEDLHEGDVDFLKLSEQEREAYQLFRRRRLDPLAYDKYVEAQPLISAYYRQPDYASKEAFKADHPEVIPYVERAWNERLHDTGFVRDQMLVRDTQQAVDFFRLSDTLELDRETAAFAENLWVGPELRRFWAGNNTPAAVRRGMLSGVYHGYLKHLSDTFFAFPESDWEARKGFLDQHPALVRWWHEQNDEADDYRALLSTAKADLRDRYFEVVKEDGWDAAAAFFRQFPFIFEGTRAEDKINPDGSWGGGGGGGGGGGRSNFRGERRGRSEHARDFLAARRWLKFYFGMPEDTRQEWLGSDAEGSRIVRDYFKKWAHPKGGFRRAEDEKRAERWLKHYFALPVQERHAWLYGGSKGGAIVLDFFKKYGTQFRVERAVQANLRGWVESRNPEIRLRLQFWFNLFQLPAADRPRYILENAERYGVFVYGPLGAKERHEREQAWLREAMAGGVSKKAAVYLRIRPLLTLYFSLPKGSPMRELFLKANSEVREYLDQNARRDGPTKSKRLNKLLDAYFKLPRDSSARSQFLQRHPEVQTYFDARSTPGERAVLNLLEVYFQQPFDARADFRAQHPEIEAYFDRKELERDLLKSLTEPFDEADPRLAPFRAAGEEWGYEVALKLERMAAERAARMYADEIELPRKGRRLPSEPGRTLSH